MKIGDIDKAIDILTAIKDRAPVQFQVSNGSWVPFWGATADNFRIDNVDAWRRTPKPPMEMFVAVGVGDGVAYASFSLGRGGIREEQQRDS